MTPKLTELQKALNKQIKQRHCPSFKSFVYNDFKTNQDAIELLELYERAIKARDSVGIQHILPQAPIWDFKYKVHQYINKYYPLQINNLKPLPEPSDIPKLEQHKTVEEFMESMENPSSNKYLREHASSFVEKYNNIDYTKQMSFESDFVTPIIIENIKELFGINDDYTAKQLVHFNYSHGYYLEPYKIKIDEWSSYCEFVTNLVKFIKVKYPTWDKMSKNDKRVAFTLFDIFENSYFKANQDKLIEIKDFIDNYGLNGQKTAKMKKLISLNFPKMTQKIASKIVDTSIKNRF